MIAVREKDGLRETEDRLRENRPQILNVTRVDVIGDAALLLALLFK